MGIGKIRGIFTEILTENIQCSQRIFTENVRSYIRCVILDVLYSMLYSMMGLFFIIFLSDGKFDNSMGVRKRTD